MASPKTNLTMVKHLFSELRTTKNYHRPPSPLSRKRADLNERLHNRRQVLMAEVEKDPEVIELRKQIVELDNQLNDKDWDFRRRVDSLYYEVLAKGLTDDIRKQVAALVDELNGKPPTPKETSDLPRVQSDVSP